MDDRRPITGLCLDGHLEGEVKTFPIGPFEHGSSYLVSKPWPNVRLIDRLGKVSSLAMVPERVEYYRHQVAVKVSPQYVLTINVFSTVRSAAQLDRENYPAIMAALYVTGFIMLTRGWPGMDEGERWTFRTVAEPQPSSH